MIGETKQQYRGVLCIHCRQPIPLLRSAELKELEFKEHGPSDLGEFSVFSVTLRCSACYGEGVYMQSDVIDLDGPPKKRTSRARPHKHSQTFRVDLPDLTKPAAE